MFKFWVLSLTIGAIILLIYLLISFNNNFFSWSKNSAFECGFDPLSTMRSPFSLRFFVLMVLFLIFDIEVSLLFPILSMLANFITPLLIISFISFVMILLVGLFYEWQMGALEWTSPSVS